MRRELGVLDLREQVSLALGIAELSIQHQELNLDHASGLGFNLPHNHLPDLVAQRSNGLSGVQLAQGQDGLQVELII